MTRPVSAMIDDSRGQTSAEHPTLSIVVPVHNAEENVVPLYTELRGVLDHLGERFEILFVNDGSQDETLPRLTALQAADAALRIVDLDGNFGDAATLSAGFHAAAGEVIVTLDGNGRNDPNDIPRLLELLREHDVQAVCGRRVHGKEDNWLRGFPAKLANALIVWVTGVPVHDCGCHLKAYKRAAIRHIHLPRGMHHFLPAILGVQARQVREIPTQERRRQHGRPRDGIRSTLLVLRDLPALRFIIRNPGKAEIRFALATAGAAACGALFLEATWLATAAFDALAVLCGLIWWNVRRFNGAQTAGVYRLREESAYVSS